MKNNKPLIIATAFLLILLVSGFCMGGYLIRQNYKNTHFVTMTIKGGLHPGVYKMTEAKKERIDAQVNLAGQQENERLRRQIARQRRKSQ